MPLFEVDTAINGYDSIRHTYVVAAKSEDEAQMKAEQKMRNWLLEHVETIFSRPAKIIR